jgi:hypothetical protein
MAPSTFTTTAAALAALLFLTLPFVVAALELAVVSTVAASLSEPVDITFDTNGDVLYLSSTFHAVFRLQGGASQLIAGGGNSTLNGALDGIGSAARFSLPKGITCDTVNNIAYISDSGNHLIRKLNLQNLSTANVSTLAGNSRGYKDAVGTAAQFSNPIGIVYYHGSVGLLYVVEYSNAHIRRIVVVTANVTTLSTSGPTSASYLCIRNNGTFLYVTSNHTVVRFNTADGTMLTLAGDSAGGYADGVGSNAKLNYPRGIALNSDETALIVVDSRNNRIRRLNLFTNAVTTIAGNGSSGLGDGTSSNAMFNNPIGAKWYCNSSSHYCGVLVADHNNTSIRFVTIEFITATMTEDNTATDSPSTHPSSPSQNLSRTPSTSVTKSPSHTAKRPSPTPLRSGSDSSPHVTWSSGSCRQSPSVTSHVSASASVSIKSNTSRFSASAVSISGSNSNLSQHGSNSMDSWTRAHSASTSIPRTVVFGHSSTFASVSPSATASSTGTRIKISSTKSGNLRPSETMVASREGCGASTPLLSAAPSIIPSPCGERFTESNLNVSNDSVPLCASLQAEARDNGGTIWSAEIPMMFVKALQLFAGRVVVAFNTTITEGLDMHDGWQFQIYTNNMTSHTANVSRVRYADLSVLLVSVTLPAGDWWNATINARITARCDSKDEVNTSTSLVFYFPAAATAGSNGATKAAEVTTAIAATAAAAFGNDVATTASLVLLSLLSCSTLAPDPGVSAYAMSVFYDHGALAMVVGNIGLAVALFLVHWSCVTFAARCVSSSRFFASRDDASSTLRFPALSMRVAEFLMPGTMFASFLCFWSADNGSGEWIAGGFGVIAVVVALVAAQGVYWRVVAPTVRFERFPHEFYLTAGSRLKATLMYPSGHWRPSAVRSRVSPLMNAFVPHREWTRTLLMMLSLLLGAVSGMATYGVGCHTGAWVAGIAHLLAGFALAVLRPYRVQWEQWMSPLLTALVGLTCMLKATGDASLSAASDSMTAAAALLQIVRTIVALWIQYREVQWSALVVASAAALPTKLGVETHDDCDDSLSAINLPHNVMEPLSVEAEQRANEVHAPQCSGDADTAAQNEPEVGDDDSTRFRSADILFNAPVMDSSSRKRDAFQSHFTGTSILEGFDGYFTSPFASDFAEEEHEDERNSVEAFGDAIQC